MLLRQAAKEFGWVLNYGAIALMWRGGCIIRRYGGPSSSHTHTHAHTHILMVEAGYVAGDGAQLFQNCVLHHVNVDMSEAYYREDGS